uniref:Uncharacterized protein n=1 Tax=Anguilla anguilla TaxID=7936 RepID=A0A0E9X0R5_ANGAN
MLVFFLSTFCVVVVRSCFNSQCKMGLVSGQSCWLDVNLRFKMRLSLSTFKHCF